MRIDRRTLKYWRPALTEAQNDMCGICGNDIEGLDDRGNARAKISYTQTRATVRGALCHGCISWLGKMETQFRRLHPGLAMGMDDVLELAAKFVLEPPAEKVRESVHKQMIEAGEFIDRHQRRQVPVIKQPERELTQEEIEAIWAADLERQKRQT